MKINFDGKNYYARIITGVVEIDTQIDLYSDWKEWVKSGSGAMFHPMFDTFGGNPLGGGRLAGDYYMFQNQNIASGVQGWRIVPWCGDYELTIVGNLYPADISKPIHIKPSGACNVFVRFDTSPLTQTVEVGSAVLPEDKTEIAGLVWDQAISAHNTPSTFGAKNQKLVPSENIEDYRASGVTIDEDALVDKIWDEPLTAITHNVQYSAGRRLRALGEVQVGQINDPSPTTTDFITDLTQSIDGFYDDQYIYFTSGALEGIVRIIAHYDSATHNIHLVKPLPQAPANGDDFEVRAEHIHSLDDITNAVWDELLSAHMTPNTYGVLMKTIDMLKEGNVSYEFIEALTDYAPRNVASGVVDKVIFKYKKTEDPDWTVSGVEIQELYLWYKNLGDTDPYLVKESD